MENYATTDQVISKEFSVPFESRNWQPDPRVCFISAQIVNPAIFCLPIPNKETDQGMLNMCSLLKFQVVPSQLA